MGDKEEAGRRFLIDNLEALLVALEIERNGRILEIDSPIALRNEELRRLHAWMQCW